MTLLDAIVSLGGSALSALIAGVAALVPAYLLLRWVVVAFRAPAAFERGRRAARTGDSESDRRDE